MATDHEGAWQSQISFDNLQNFNPSFLELNIKNVPCECCQQSFSTCEKYKVHKGHCDESTSFKGKQSTKLKSKLRPAATTDNNHSSKILASRTDAKNVKNQPGLSGHNEIIGEKEKEERKVKQLDLRPGLTVASQYPLGAQNKHQKCGQGELVSTSDEELTQHLSSIKKAIVKCSQHHLVHNDRKDDIFKLKVNPERQKGVYIGERVYLPNEGGEYTWNTCDRAFKDKDLLIKHLTWHIKLKPHECLECKKKVTRANPIQVQQQRHPKKENFQCNFCQKKFFTPNKLKEHIRTHTGKAPSKYKVCKKGFKQHSNLSKHKTIHEPKPVKKLLCHCGNMFNTQRNLDWHVKGEHNKVPKKCTYCSEVLVHPSSLTRHIRIKHKSSFMPEGKQTNNYANCPACNQVFYKTSINKHIRVSHQGQKPYIWEICNKEFVAKCILDNHMWQHDDQRQRPLKCLLCNKAFLCEPLLQQHLRSHKGIKPFVCNEWGLQFTNKSNWQRHEQEHSEARNYKCRICGEKFSESHYLTDHMKAHTKERPFGCNICGTNAATKSNCNSHLRNTIRKTRHKTEEDLQNSSSRPQTGYQP